MFLGTLRLCHRFSSQCKRFRIFNFVQSVKSEVGNEEDSHLFLTSLAYGH